MIALLLAATASATPIVLYDLEGDDGGFAASGDAGQWEWGTVLNGPGSGFDGTRAWTTGRVADYLNASTDYLEIPVPSLEGLSRPTLSFQHWYEINPGDYAWVEVDIGNGWAAIEPLYGYPVVGGYTGASGGWRTAVFDLSAYGVSPDVRLVFQADLSGVGAGWTVDQVAFHDGDVAAPKLSGLAVLADTDDLVGPYVVEVTAEDDTSVAKVELKWRAGGDEGSVEMLEVGVDTWRGAIPAQLPDTDVRYWIEATDGLNSSREPVDDDLAFRVYLPAPTGLTGPSERVVDTQTTLSWTAPESRNAVRGYEVVRAGLVVAQATDTDALVPLTGGSDTFSVRAVYDAGAGDLSEPWSVDAAVPAVAGLDPAEGWPGDTLRVALTGEYLLMVAGDVAADLGSGIAVTGVDVRDVDSAWLDLALDPAAKAGSRTLTLQTGGVSLTLPDAFEVLDGADRPRLVEIEPDSVRQGDAGELVISHVGALETTPTVDLGEGIVVNAVEVDAGAVLVRYTVTGDAPLGERAVTVDDGVRVLGGVLLEVKDAVAPAAGGCGTPVSPGYAVVGLGMAALAVRRRR